MQTDVAFHRVILQQTSVSMDRPPSVSQNRQSESSVVCSGARHWGRCDGFVAAQPRHWQKRASRAVLRNEVVALWAPGERLNLLGLSGVHMLHAGLRWAHMYTRVCVTDDALGFRLPEQLVRRLTIPGCRRCVRNGAHRSHALRAARTDGGSATTTT